MVNGQCTYNCIILNYKYNLNYSCDFGFIFHYERNHFYIR